MKLYFVYGIFQTCLNRETLCVGDGWWGSMGSMSACVFVCVCVHEVWGMCGGSGCVYVCLHVSVGVVGVSVSVGDATHHVGVCSISQVSCWDMLQ